MTEAYPLHWPLGWRRTPPAQRKRASFGKSTRTEHGWYRKDDLTVPQATERLRMELVRLGTSAVVISTNVELNSYGEPRGGRRSPDDPGAAVYFQRNGKPYSLACDRWDRVADNIAAIAKHIEAMRGMERWGVGTLDRIFEGFAALPAPGMVSKRHWRQVLGAPSPCSLELAERLYRQEARRAHPDNGGNHAAMAELNIAIAEARADLRGAA